MKRIKQNTQMQNEIVEVKNLTSPITLSGENALENAKAIAQKIQSVVAEQGLAVKVGTDKFGKEKLYAMVEAWNMIGTMLGYSPRVVKNQRVERENGVYGYEAWVELVDTTGFVRASANALAMSNEKKGYRPAPWTENEFSVASMAQTRATGKAYRLGLSWVMKMAGYEPTPYEEMNVVEINPQQEVSEKENLKKLAFERLFLAKTPDEYLETYEKIKSSGKLTEKELREVADRVINEKNATKK